jgi:hypothetical protein
MAAWSGLLALSGFRYHGGEQAVEMKGAAGHRCFWSTATGWGTLHVTASGATIHVEHGTLAVKTCTVNGRRSSPGRTLREGEDLSI